MSSIKTWNAMVSQLKRLMKELPSTEERDELTKGITDVMNVLTEVSRSLNNLPTSVEATNAKEGLERMENVLRRNPLLIGVLQKSHRAGVPGARLPRPSGKMLPLPNDQVQKEINLLSEMSEDALHRRLEEENRYSKNVLRSLLAAFGKRISTKAARNEMIEQLVVAMVNRRTYEGLSRSHGTLAER